MTTVPALLRRGPALYRKTTVLRRLAWVLLCAPITALFGVIWAALATATAAICLVANAFCWLAWGKDWEEHVHYPDQPICWYTDYGWTNIRVLFLSQQWPVEWHTTNPKVRISRARNKREKEVERSVRRDPRILPFDDPYEDEDACILDDCIRTSRPEGW